MWRRFGGVQRENSRVRVLDGALDALAAEPVVALRGLAMAFNGRRVLEDVSFDVRPGEVVAVLGEAASAKTTLFELILGLLRPLEGSVQVSGCDSHEMPRDARARVGWAAEPPELVAPLSVEQHIDLMASFHERWDGERLRDLCRDGGLDLRERVAEMSAARRKTFSVLLALGHGPDLLLVDEPIAGLDDREKRWLLDLLARFSAETGAALVLFSSSPEAARIATTSFRISERRLVPYAPFRRRE